MDMDVEKQRENDGSHRHRSLVNGIWGAGDDFPFPNRQSLWLPVSFYAISAMV
jgi:hypothetical protein